MASSRRIEDMIDDITDFLNSCKTQRFSQNILLVPKEELFDLLDELRLRLPEEVTRYKRIIANRDSILAAAEEKAKTIEEEARKKAEVIVSENEIMQQVLQQANEIMTNANASAEQVLSSANEEAEQIRTGALEYTNDILSGIEEVFRDTLNVTAAHAENLINTLKDSLEIVGANKKEISEQLERPDINDIAYIADSIPDSDKGDEQDEEGYDENTYDDIEE